MAGEVRNSTRLGRYITSPFDWKFSGCMTKGMRMGPWRNPYEMSGCTVRM